jgi:hypothetical protein
MEMYYIGASPYEEDCAQTVNPDFHQKNRKECILYMEQLVRQLGLPPGGSYLSCRTEEHDFGHYREVVFHFDPTDPAQQQYADLAENGAARWDRTAAAALGLNLEEYPE